MADGDTVPMLPVRTRVGTLSSRQQGLVLTSPDAGKVGKLRAWADYTPAASTTPAGAGFPTPSPGGKSPVTMTAATPAPGQLFEATPTPMDAPYYQPGFGFGLPPQTVQTTQVMQPMQTMQSGQQPMMYMMPAGGQMQMQQPAMAGTVVASSAGAVPGFSVAPVQQAPFFNGGQMVVVGMMPAAQMMPANNQPVSVMDQPETGARAGRQLLGDALNDNSLDPGGQAVVGPNGQLTSPGSELHGTGRCNPCAWFWKPKGCMNAATCSYCHLCPEGELKQRKKAKVTAMRMGGLEPSQDGAPPQIKLDQLLGDS